VLVTNAPEPVLAPGEALIRPTRLLVSAADLDATKSSPDHPGFRGVLGSQFVGVVKSINLPADASPALKARASLVGKRVVASPALPCATCDLCRAGLSPHCRARTVLGVHQRDGCFQDLFTLPLNALCTVTDSVTDDQAVFAHALSGALHAANMLRSEHNSYITILGDSVLAMLCAQVLARMNKTVRVLSSRPDRAGLCERWGIKHRPLAEPGRRQDQDVVVDCTGSSAGLKLAMQFVRPRGMILLKSPAALAPCPPGRPIGDVLPGSPWTTPVDLTPAVVNEVQIVGSRDGPIADALRILSENTIDISGLISKRFKFDDALAAMTAAAAPEALGIVIDV
jgi:threonine dehydrogenase-like Zn-dependent dehydrogenase